MPWEQGEADIDCRSPPLEHHSPTRNDCILEGTVESRPPNNRRLVHRNGIEAVDHTYGHDTLLLSGYQSYLAPRQQAEAADIHHTLGTCAEAGNRQAEAEAGVPCRQQDLDRNPSCHAALEDEEDHRWE